ncbi:MAG: sulfatase [Marinifilum sp.]|jgi:N-sulfoglucosamine sulfohydrolase|nr:sulfatase [Marinifilum sp.]
MKNREMKLRNIFKQSLLIGATAMSICSLNAKEKIEKVPLNVLLITADDLNCSSVGAYGCTLKNITPNIDKLARDGLRFKHAHVNVAVCQPSRGVLATGLYSHNSGIEGYYHTSKKIPTIINTLHSNGFLTGVIGKVEHSTPTYDTPWDVQVDMPELGMGRNKELYYKSVQEFLKRAKAEGKPFYLMANSHDPHRPFSGSDDELKRWGEKDIKSPSRIYNPSEIKVPGFLPDIPKVRREIAEYYSSVKRCDETVGRILDVLEQEGLTENTIVMFLSDNGMAFPFAKTNCYLHSTNTPWLVRWPGVIEPGAVDEEHFISGKDFFPTILDILNLPIPEKLNGFSFKDVLLRKKQTGRKDVFTQFYMTSGYRTFPMRCVQNKQYGYIFNAWSDGNRAFKNESQHGYTWKAMKEYAQSDSLVNKRVQLFSNRIVEEFYDFENDPDALNNLIDDPNYASEIAEMQGIMERSLKESNDPLLDAFLNRYDIKKLQETVSAIQKEAFNRKNTERRH